MIAQSAILFLAQVLVQISCQCIGAYNGYPAEGLAWGPTSYAPGPWELAYAAGPYEIFAPYGPAPCAAEWNVGYNPAALAASHGPGLAVTSASPVPPIGVTTVSDTAVSGGLAVAGQIPFLSAVVLEGAVPTVGAGAISYGCGNGGVAILNEDFAPGGYDGFLAAPLEFATAPYGYGPVAAGPAFGYGPVAVGPAYGYNEGYGCGCGSRAIY